MTYQSVDESEEGGASLLLFEFLQGSTYYRYVAQAEAVDFTVGGQLHTWAPEVLLPSEFGQCSEFGKERLTIKLPTTNALAQRFLDYAPDKVTTLTVYRGFIGESQAIVYWPGRVQSTSRESGFMVLNCEPIPTSLRRPGLRALYTRSCRHVLYSEACGLNRADFDNTQYVWECAGDRVRLNQFLFQPGYIIGGTLVSADGTERTIMDYQRAQGGDWVTLMRPIRYLAEWLAANPGQGAPVTLYVGCDHSFAACKSKNNQGHFGGFPWFPQRNPFTTSIV